MTTEQTTAELTASSTTAIPLNRLHHSDANVRRTGKADEIEALAASIAAHGLRQNLNVLLRPNGTGYEVVAGGRRLRALKQLVRSGKMAKDAPIPCLVLDVTCDPSEISLAENAMRTAMHPDDQCEAFSKMIEEREMSVEDVAARFGVTPAIVRQRLKLASVSPKLRAIYRKGGMTLDHVMALTIGTDHAAQEAAWAALPDWNRSASALKRALTGGTVPATDRLARFVGLKAYNEAGGAVLRDLFDAEEAGYFADAALVQRLAAEKLEAAAAEVRAEGWKWTVCELTRDYSTSYGRVWPQRVEDGPEGEEIESVYSAEDTARAGARLCVGHDGEVQVERGLVHPDDLKSERKRQSGERSGAAASGLSAALVAELTAHRTAALRIELARNPAVALAATVQALALPILYHGKDSSCLALRAESEELVRHVQAETECSAHKALAEEAERWREVLPSDPADLFAWCLAQPQERLLDLLAYIAALSVDAVRGKFRPAAPLEHADRLADALSLDMQGWWTPSVDVFWRKLPKSMLTQALDEAKAPPLGVALDKLKKPEAARLTAQALDGSGWLPEPLRTKAADEAKAEL